MLRTTTPSVEAAIKKIHHRVLDTLLKFKRNTAKGEPWIGLAISGGVDSMALAAVCSDLQNLEPTFQRAFRGFIVDHGVRKGSDEEASKVARELERIGISAKVLKLAWGGQDPKTATNFETLARKLRYRALGTACWDARISKLLVAHHADDQAETILSRIVSGYMGSGLQGIKKYSQIPECKGIYGVDASGWNEYQTARWNPPQYRSLFEEPSRFWYEVPDTRIEGGGVFLHRPLLPFTKEDLIAVCRAKRVQWFEDQTNADKTLTQRNTVRHLMKNNALPMALQDNSLLSMATNVRQGSEQIEQEAERLFDALPIKFFIQTGTVELHLDDEILKLPDRPPEEVYHILAMLLRRLLLLVSPCDEIALQDLDQAMNVVFPWTAPSPTSPKLSAQTQIAGVNIVRYAVGNEEQCRNMLTMDRAIPTKVEAENLITIPQAQDDRSPWFLWDSRYWFRLRIPPNEHIAWQIRFLAPELLRQIRKSLHRLLGHEKLSDREKWTVPVLTATDMDGKLLYADLPSLRRCYYSAVGLDDGDILRGRIIDVRYKNVALKGKHGFSFKESLVRDHPFEGLLREAVS